MTQTLRRSDSEIKSAVVDELEWTPSVDSTHVGVAVDNGAVTLSGEVDSYPGKLMATNAAQRVHGVTAIAQEHQRDDAGRGRRDPARHGAFMG